MIGPQGMLERSRYDPSGDQRIIGLWGTTERKRTIRKMKWLEERIERQLPRSNKPPHSPERDDLASVIKPPVEPIEEIDTFLIVLFRSVVPQRGMARIDTVGEFDF